MKHAGSWRALMEGDWTPEQVETWYKSRETLLNVIELNFRWPEDCPELMFPDANGLF